MARIIELMRRQHGEVEGWKRMVLHSGTQPAWLSDDAPHGDVVLSTRTRYLRNIHGFRFPHRERHEALEKVMRMVLGAARPLCLESYRALSEAERNYFVGCRLLAPDYAWTLPNRLFLVDQSRTLSVMVNEEDHIRLQALTAGWSPANAEGIARYALRQLESSLSFAHSPNHGYLAASPFNSGLGRRQSAMFHLIGLAQNHRLPSILKALSVRGLSVRGLFGESSRAIGAFAQVSLVNGADEDFTGACDYLVQEERMARSVVGLDLLAEKAGHACDLAVRSRLLSLADALRILAWLRWSASAGISVADVSLREVDEALTLLDLGRRGDAERSAQERAVFVREALRLT